MVTVREKQTRSEMIQTPSIMMDAIKTVKLKTAGSVMEEMPRRLTLEQIYAEMEL